MHPENALLLTTMHFHRSGLVHAMASVPLRGSRCSETIRYFTPTTIIMMAVFLGFTAITTAMVDERFWGFNGHDG